MNEYDVIREREGLPNERGRKRASELIQRVRKDELLRLLVSGMSLKECAPLIRVSVWTVRNYVRSAFFQEELRKLSEDVWKRVDEELSERKVSKTQRLENLGERALERIEELLESNDERVVARVASDVLDRNKDTSKHHKTDNTIAVVNLTGEQLLLAHRAAQEIEGHLDIVKEDIDARVQ